MVQETGMAAFIRGLVKFVFIACYVAFMWASIHHVATYFSNFEQDSSNMFGSYLLAGAFDVTALVTTIGVMFFRKSMPTGIQVLVWVFILAIAVYSYIINWEYASHYQNADLILQPTGAMLAVYDHKNVLHYIPEMKANTSLQFLNPLLASGFTIFSLIYSVVAEFFGTKPPTIEELQAKKQYLEDTASVVESIKTLEGKGKGKSLIQAAKDKAMEAKTAWKEVTQKDEDSQESGQERERNTDELAALTGQETSQETSQDITESNEENGGIHGRKQRGKGEEKGEIWHMEKMPSWLTTGGSTIALETVAKETNLNIRKLRNRVESKIIRATKNKEIVYKDSLIAWLQTEGILVETPSSTHLELVRNDEESYQEDNEQPQEMEAVNV